MDSLDRKKLSEDKKHKDKVLKFLKKKIDFKKLKKEAEKKFLLRESLVNNSIHLGNKHVSNYKKGYDCLIDSLLLSDCNILYKSTGNFSMFCKLFNKKIDDLEVIQLNNI